MRYLVRAGGLEPPRAFAQRIFVPSTAFAAAQDASSTARLRSGLSLHPVRDKCRRVRCCPSSLYTFPAGRSLRPGLARDCHLTGSPEFGQFYVAGFPASTQVVASSPLRLPFRHARRGNLAIARFVGRATAFSAVAGGPARLPVPLAGLAPTWHALRGIGMAGFRRRIRPGRPESSRCPELPPRACGTPQHRLARLLHPSPCGPSPGRICLIRRQLDLATPEIGCVHVRNRRRPTPGGPCPGRAPARRWK